MISMHLITAVVCFVPSIKTADGVGENKGCELWGYRGLIYIYRVSWSWHGKGVSISDTSTLTLSTVKSLWRGLSTNPGMTIWCVCYRGGIQGVSLAAGGRRDLRLHSL